MIPFRSLYFGHVDAFVFIVSKSLQVLNDQGGSTATAVADTSATNLGTLLLQDGGESGDDTGTRGAERVANGDGATKDVDIVTREAENLHVGEGNNGESLVDLVEVDVLFGEASVLNGLGDGKSGSDGESLRFTLSVGPAENLGKGLDSELLDLGLGHEDNSGGAIVDGGGVGSGDGTVRLEGRAHGLELVLVQVLDFVIAFDLDRGLATAAADLDGDNLLEEAGFGGGLSLLVRVDGVLVLSLAGEVVVGGAQLALETHVLLLEGIGQTILENTVDEGLVAVLGAASQVGEVVGGVGHGLGATGDDNGRGAEHDVLGSEDDGLEGRGADLVDSRADGAVGETGADGALAGGSLAETAEGRELLVWRNMQQRETCTMTWASYPAERTLPK